MTDASSAPTVVMDPDEARRMADDALARALARGVSPQRAPLTSAEEYARIAEVANAAAARCSSVTRTPPGGQAGRH